MGCRAQVKMISKSEKCPIFLYTHWGGSAIFDVIKIAIRKQWRWNDFEYLTRIIFEEMIGEQRGSETGFGIGTSEHGDIEYLVTVDTDKQTIEFNDLWNPEQSYHMTFKEITTEYGI